MTIHFYLDYLDGDDEVHITSFHDLPTNPFKLNDAVTLDVSWLFPVETNKFEGNARFKVMDENEKLIERFSGKTIELVKESKYVRFNNLNEPTITIEYHSIIIEKDLVI